jgi:hypothetical protein
MRQRALAAALSCVAHAGKHSIEAQGRARHDANER